MFTIPKGFEISNQHPSYAAFVAIQKVKETIIGDNEIFLGFKHKLGVSDVEDMNASRLRREVVTVPLPPTGELYNTLVTGQAGSGKTQGMGFHMIVDNLIRRFGDRCNTLLIDPPGEYSVIHKVLPESSNPRRIWEALGLTPKFEISPRLYTPYACADPDDKIGSYKINLEQITLDDLITICDVKSGKDEDERQVDMLTEAVYHWYTEHDIKNPQADPMCPPFSELMETIIRNKLGGRVLRRTLMNLRNQGFVGNEPEYPAPPIVQNLYRNDGQPSIQVLKTSTDEFLSRRMAGLVQVELKKLIAEQRRRYEYIKAGHSITHLPLLLGIDEFQRVYRTQFFKGIYDTAGKYLVYIVGLLPSLADLPDNTPIRQSNLLICARIAPSEEKGVKEILGKLIDPTILSELEDPGKGNYPKQFALIKKERTITDDMEADNIITFYPGLTITRIVKRRSVVSTYRQEPVVEQTKLVEDFEGGVEVREIAHDDLEIDDDGGDEVIEEADDEEAPPQPIPKNEDITPPENEGQEESSKGIMPPKLVRELRQYPLMSARQSEIYDELRYQLNFFQEQERIGVYVYVSNMTVGRNIGLKGTQVKSVIYQLKKKGFLVGNMVQGWTILMDEYGKRLDPPLEYNW